MNALLLAALILSPWAPEKETISVERGEGDAWSFRHTGAKNWCVNITDRLKVVPGDRYEMKCDTSALGDADGRFVMNVCLFAADGTAVDWQFANERMKPGRKVATEFVVPAGVAQMYARFRGDGPAAAKVNAFSLERVGSVFPEGYVAPQEPELAAAAQRDFETRDTFDGDPGMTESLRGRRGFFIRDVAAGGKYRPIAEADDFVFEVKRSVEDDSKAFDVTLTEKTGRDRAVSFVYAVALPDGPITWHETMRRSETFTLGERQYNVSQGEAGRGRLARWPFGAVTCGGSGFALGIDPEAPALHRFGANATTRQLYVVFDLGFAKEHPAAHFRFRGFTFDGAQGLRGALVAYRRLFPEMFRVRCEKHGLWTVMDSLKTLPGLEDFGFRFRGRMGEIGFDDEHDYLTFRYTEPSTWWVSLPKEMRGKPYTLQDGVEMSEKLAAQGPVEMKTALAQATPPRHAQAWKTSVILDEDGERVGRKCKQSWCEGVIWALNSAPGIGGPGAMNDFRAKIAPELFDARYAEPFPKGLDGEYYDSAEMYMTPWCDFNRAHFAGMDTPLVFDRDSKRPAVWKGMIAYEYIREASRLAHDKGRLTLANCTPIKWWFLVPFLDVPGSEVWWVKEKEDRVLWQPMDDEDFMFRRAMCGGKPLCFLMDAPFDHFTKEMTEKYFQRSLAYGALPSFFTWHGVTTFGNNIYFKRPDCYERDRPLFKKYVPLCKAVSEAGWQPINAITESATEGVITEQFGELGHGGVYATVFNLTDKPVKALIKVKTAATRFEELVTGTQVEVASGALALDLPPETVRVLKVLPEGTEPKLP
jgi:hypothetical protein